MTALSTIDALLYELRSGLSCLFDPNCKDRLVRCDREAMRTIAKELLSWPGKTKDGQDRSWLPAWNREDVAKLLTIRRGIK